MARKSKSRKAQSTYAVFARTDAGTVQVGPARKAPLWRVNAMVGMLLERPDVANAWYKVVTA